MILANPPEEPEWPLPNALMWYNEVSRIDAEPSIEQDIEINGSRTIPYSIDTTQILLNLLKHL